MSTELVPTFTGQADLFGDAQRLAAMPDVEFRVRCSELLSAVRKRDVEVAYAVGRMLAEANRRWEKDDYTSFVEEAAKALDRHPSTLWRWRRDAEKALGVAPEAPARGTRATRVRAPSISAKSPTLIEPEISDTGGAGPSHNTPPVSDPSVSAGHAKDDALPPDLPPGADGSSQGPASEGSTDLDAAAGPAGSAASGPALSSGGVSATREGAVPAVSQAQGKKHSTGPSSMPPSAGSRSSPTGGESLGADGHGARREAGDRVAVCPLETPLSAEIFDPPDRPTVDYRNAVLNWVGRWRTEDCVNLDGFALAASRRTLNGEQSRRDAFAHERRPRDVQAFHKTGRRS